MHLMTSLNVALQMPSLHKWESYASLVFCTCDATIHESPSVTAATTDATKRWTSVGCRKTEPVSARYSTLWRFPFSHSALNCNIGSYGEYTLCALDLTKTDVKLTSASKRRGKRRKNRFGTLWIIHLCLIRILTRSSSVYFNDSFCQRE